MTLGADFTKTAFKVTLRILIVWQVLSGGQALQAAAPVSGKVEPYRTLAICGHVDQFLGYVQWIDASRNHLLDLKAQSAIPCGTWLLVQDGWVHFQALSGSKVDVGPHSFVQLVEAEPGEKDRLIHYRGAVWLHADVTGSGTESVLVSPLSKIRLKNGIILALYEPQGNRSQLIALENAAVIENRYEPGRSMKVHAGEESELNLNLRRLTPLWPQALAVAEVRPLLTQLHVTEREEAAALQAIMKRQSEKLTQPVRVPATEMASSDYSGQHLEQDQPDLYKHWVAHQGGGEEKVKEILFPEQIYRKTETPLLEMHEAPEKYHRPSASFGESETAAAEKKKLMDLLTQVQRVD